MSPAVLNSKRLCAASEMWFLLPRYEFLKFEYPEKGKKSEIVRQVSTQIHAQSMHKLRGQTGVGQSLYFSPKFKIIATGHACKDIYRPELARQQRRSLSDSISTTELFAAAINVAV